MGISESSSSSGVTLALGLFSSGITLLWPWENYALLQFSVLKNRKILTLQDFYDAR